VPGPCSRLRARNRPRSRRSDATPAREPQFDECASKLRSISVEVVRRFISLEVVRHFIPFLAATRSSTVGWASPCSPESSRRRSPGSNAATRRSMPSSWDVRRPACPASERPGPDRNGGRHQAGLTPPPRNEQPRSAWGPSRTT
jgi:hypothetical protein